MNLTLENLRDYITEEGDCWMWNLSTKSNGYPQATIGDRGGVLVKRHIFALGNQLNRGWRVISTCGERRCVNPEHLAQRSPGRILRDAYRDGKRVDNYASKLAARISNKGLPPVLTDEQKARIDELKGEMPFEQIAALIGRAPSAVARYANGDTHRRALRNSSVFEWRP